MTYEQAKKNYLRLLKRELKLCDGNLGNAHTYRAYVKAVDRTNEALRVMQSLENETLTFVLNKCSVKK